jgi:hypothetical protein
MSTTASYLAIAFVLGAGAIAIVDPQSGIGSVPAAEGSRCSAAGAISP